MPARVVTVNQEVEALRPRTSQWRAAKVVEDANEDHDKCVKVKFNRDTQQHDLPWHHIKFYDSLESHSFLKTTARSRPASRVITNPVAIDLTISDNEVFQTSPSSNSHFENMLPAPQFSSQHAASQEAPSVRRHPDPYLPPVSQQLSNGTSSRFGIDVGALYNRTPDRDEGSYGGFHRGAISNPEPSGNSPSRYKTPATNVFSSPHEPGYPASLRQHEGSKRGNQRHHSHENIGSIPIPRERHMQSERASIPTIRERHPHRAFEDVPIPRARAIMNESSTSFFRKRNILELNTTRKTGDADPSKRPRLLTEIVGETASIIPPSSPRDTPGISRRLQKKKRESSYESTRIWDSSEKSQSSFTTHGGLFKRDCIGLEGFEPVPTFPHDKEYNQDCSVDVLNNTECEMMVSEWKDDFRTILGSFTRLELAREPKKASRECGRKKTKPKKWIEQGFVQQSIFSDEGGSPYRQQKEASERLTDLQPVIGDKGKGPPVPKVFRCKCGISVGSTHRDSAVQCGICGCWNHIRCIHSNIEDRTSAERKKNPFVCVLCMDEVIDNVLHKNYLDGEDIGSLLLPQSNHIAAKNHLTILGSQEWQSHLSPVAEPKLPLRPVGSKCSRKQAKVIRSPRFRPRPPLDDSEVEARAQNIEMLRAGVCRPSVGAKGPLDWY